MLIQNGLGREETKEAAQCLFALDAKGSANELMGLLEPGTGLTEKISSLLSSAYTKDQAESTLKEWGNLGLLSRPRFDATKCDLKLLDDTAFLYGEEARVGKLIRLVNSTVGATCQNYLPWKDSYVGGTGYIDRIRPEGLNSPVQWGIDSARRFFVAIRHACDRAGTGAITYFQRHTNLFERPTNYESVVSGGHHATCGFYADSWYDERDIQKLTDLLTTGAYEDIRLA